MEYLNKYIRYKRRNTKIVATELVLTFGWFSICRGHITFAEAKTGSQFENSRTTHRTVNNSFLAYEKEVKPMHYAQTNFMII